MYMSGKIHIGAALALLILISLSSLGDPHPAVGVIIFVTSFGSALWIVADMADHRNRSATKWVIASLFLNAYIAMLLLKLLGSGDPESYERWTS